MSEGFLKSRSLMRPAFLCFELFKNIIGLFNFEDRH